MRGYDGPDRAAGRGRLARSLLAHGKAREAELWTRRAEAAGDSPEAQHARLLLELVSTRLDRDPEIPLAPGEELAAAGGARLLASARPELVASAKPSEYPEVLAALGARRYVTGYKVLEKWPEDLWAGLGKDFSLLTGFLDYKAEIYADADRRAEGAGRRRRLRRPPPRGVLLPGAVVLRGVAVTRRRLTRWSVTSARRPCWGGTSCPRPSAVIFSGR